MTSNRMTPDTKGPARVDAARKRAEEGLARDRQPDPMDRPDGPSPDVAKALDQKPIER